MQNAKHGDLQRLLHPCLLLRPVLFARPTQDHQIFQQSGNQTKKEVYVTQLLSKMAQGLPQSSY